MRFNQVNQLPNSAYLFMEPALTAAAGTKRFQVVFQLFGWITLFNSSQFQIIDMEQTYGRLGLLFGLNRNEKKKSEP